MPSLHSVRIFYYSDCRINQISQTTGVNMLLNRFLITLTGIFAVAVLLAGCGGPQTETDRINQWFDEKYEEYLQMNPMMLTQLGRKEQYDQVDDMSEEAVDQMLDWRASTVAEMNDQFDYEQLEPEAQISFDLWEYQYEILRDGREFLRHNYIFDQMRSVHTRVPNFLINFHNVDEKQDMNDYISRVEGISRAIGQLLERADLQAEMDIRPPRFSHEIVIRQAEALLDGVPFTDGDDGSPLWDDATAKIDSLVENGAISDDEADNLREETRTALLDHFQPAYQNLIEWVTSDMEYAEARPTGVSRHVNGEAYYNYMLRYNTTTDLTAEEIHQIGLDEVDRIMGEMEVIKNEVGFDGDMQAFFEFYSTDGRFFYPNTDEGRQGYIEDSKAYLDALEDKLDEFFGILPQAGLVVRRVEPFREQDGAPQHYMPGTPDGSRSGVYYAHLSDMSSMPKTTMEAIAYHEGNPGHHMQISIAQELENVPQFRTQERFTVYTEGWALYSEKLAKEMGGYEDPYSDFGRLVTEMWRAIRLVVDTGLHAKGWTEADAVAYFKEHSPIADGAIRAEVRRYMVMPGQATGYKIGMIKIEELRAHAEEELGDQFDIRSFHDTVLGGGSLPLHILEDEVNRWIDSQKAG